MIVGYFLFGLLLGVWIVDSFYNVGVWRDLRRRIGGGRS